MPTHAYLPLPNNATRLLLAAHTCDQLESERLKVARSGKAVIIRKRKSKNDEISESCYHDEAKCL